MGTACNIKGIATRSLLTLALAIQVFSTVAASTIDPVNRYAYGANIGCLAFESNGEAVFYRVYGIQGLPP